ncbi:MAG TPA: Ku protein [Longimicrobiales bacterium]
MAKQAERAAKRTELRFGLATAPIALLKTTGETDEPSFEKAGPNGGKLKTEMRPDPEYKPVDEESSIVPPTPEEIRAAQKAVDEVAERARKARESEVPEVPVVVEEGTGVEVAEPRRGIRLADGSFVDLTDELARIDERTRLDAMDTVAFIRREQVPRERILGSYFLAGDGAGAMRLLRTLFMASRTAGRVPVVRWTKTKRQAVGVIVPALEDGKQHLKVLELAFAEDVREVPERADLNAVTASDEDVEAATALIEAMADSSAALDEVTDERARLLRELVARAEAGEFHGFEVPERPELPDNVVDLTALLRASIKRAKDFTAAA